MQVEDPDLMSLSSSGIDDETGDPRDLDNHYFLEKRYTVNLSQYDNYEVLKKRGDKNE